MKIDSDKKISKHFMPHQIAWIQAEKAIHRQHKQAVALAEKSVRIGWTYADAFKNVRKRLWFKGRDYLFATKDYPSALEFVRQCYSFAQIFNLTRAIISHGEDSLSLQRLDAQGRPSSFTEDVKIGIIKFDNGSRIIAFSSNPQAMSVYGGDVGLDEFAKHPNARLLWETAQARVTWNFDLAVWSSHDGEDTLFNEFAREARSACAPYPCHEPVEPPPGFGVRQSSAALDFRTSARPSVHGRDARPEIEVEAPHSSALSSPPPHLSTLPKPPWNLYFRVTLPDAIRFGLVETINPPRGPRLPPAQFLPDCRARPPHQEIFQQSYLWNPLGAAASRLVEWSAIERCRSDYPIERVHLEADQILRQFGQFNPDHQRQRQSQIAQFLHDSFPTLFQPVPPSTSATRPPSPSFRLGFDVAASGQGDLAAIYIDQADGDQLSLRALFTCRTDDWHFLKTVLFHFLEHVPRLRAAGDESGLGRQICWEAAQRFSSRFAKVNLASKKHDLRFALMNQLSVAEQRFPFSHPDIAADFFALRKT